MICWSDQRKIAVALAGEAHQITMRLPPQHAVRKASPYHVRLIESYCLGCGLLIAASPRDKILATMERLHMCPVYFRRGQERGQTPGKSHV